MTTNAQPDERSFPNGRDTSISAGHAYAAMVSFLEAFWERDGCPKDSMPKLLSWMQQQVWADGSPADPAMWSDWLDTIRPTQPEKSNS